MGSAPSRPLRPAGAILALLLPVFLLAGCEEEPPPRLITAESTLSRGDAWTELYPPVEAHPLLDRARRVFAQMRDATGVMADLIVLDLGPAPYALALPDRSILLSTSALELCYSLGDDAEGDFYLAWILGHELDHVGKNDFWHASTYAALEGADDGEEAIARLWELLRLDNRDRQVIELRADAAGVLAAVEGGYDPAPLASGEAREFFKHWSGRPGGSGAIATDESTHPASAERDAALSVLRRETIAKLALFEEGVAALESAERLGPDADPEKLRTHLRMAIEQIGAFRSAFEGREVLNNLAVAHLRLAALEIARCDGPRVTRFYLPTVVDPVTLAKRFVPRSGEDGLGCPASTGARHLERATELLERAVDRDPGYAFARQNLVVAYLLDGRASHAVPEAETLRELDPDHPHARLAHPLSLLALIDEGAPWVDGSVPLAALEKLQQTAPDDRAVVYDLAMAHQRHGNPETAEHWWRAFLRLENEGPWAEVARSYLGS